MAELTETHRDILRHELEAAEHERAKLDSAIAYLRGRLGISADEASSPGSGDGAPATAQRLDPGADIAAAINPGRFYGYASSRAAKQVLEMVGEERPLRTIEIFRAVKKGGGSIKDPETLARTLKRNKTFHRVGRGLWGLRSWYPAGAKEWAPQAGEPEDDDLSDENGSEEGTGAG